MIVLHVGNFGSRPKGAFLHSTAPKLSRGLVRAGHSVVDFPDRDIARAASIFGSRNFGIGAANRELTRIAHHIRPDLLLLGHADIIHAETVANLRRAMPSLRVLQWNVDPLFEADNCLRIRNKAEVVDATLVSTAGDALRTLSRPGMRLGFMPNPVDFSIETGRSELKACLPWDIFYACGDPRRPCRNIFGRYWDMDVFIDELRKLIPDLRAKLAGLEGTRHLVGASYQEALRSCAAGLNISKRNDVFLYSSDRLAHIAGNGQAVLIDRASGYETLFSKHEMCFFSTMEELAANLRLLIADPPMRQAVAAAGRLRYHELFNETTIAQYVSHVAFDSHDATRYEWPTLIN